MKDKKIPKKLKGTVLYTVVSVMMVLIVFLMGTLALASTANNRAYKNYQKEQTEYTARAVLDAVLSKANERDPSNGELTTAAKDLQDAIDGTAGTEAHPVQLTQVTMSDSATPYTVMIAKKSDVGHYYNGTEWKEFPVFQLSVTVGKASTSAETTYTADIGVDITNNPGNNPSNGGGAFVSMGNVSGGHIGTSGLVTGGSTINMTGSADDILTLDNSTINEAPVFINGCLVASSQVGVKYTGMKEKQYLAITGDLTVNNNMTMEVLDDTFRSPANYIYKEIPFLYVGGKLDVASSGSFVTDVPVNLYVGELDMGGSQGAIDTKGDVYVFTDGGSTVLGNSAHDAKLYDWASRTFSIQDSAGNVTDTKFGNLYSRGNVTVKENGAEITGDIRTMGDVTITSDKSSFCTVNGNVICNGKLTIANGSKLILKDSSSKVYAAEIELQGNAQILDSAGNPVNIADPAQTIVWTWSKAHGNVPVTRAEAITVTEKTKTTRYENFTYTVSAVNPWGPYVANYSYDETVTEKTLQNGVEISNTTNQNTYSGVADLNYGSDIFSWNAAELYDIKQKVNQDITTSDVETISVVTYKYNDGTGDQDVDWSNVSIADPANPAVKVAEVKGDVYPNDYTQPNIYSSQIDHPDPRNYVYPTTLQEATYEVLGNTNTLPNWDGSSLITQSCVINQNINQSLTIDSSAGAILIVIQGNVGMQNGTDITIKDEKGVTFFIDQNSTFSLNKTRILTEDYKNLISSGNLDFNANQANAASQYYPNVYVWGGDNSTFTGGSEPSTITANIRAPKTAVKMNNGYLNGGGGSATIKYNGESLGTKQVGLFGQLIAGSIEVGNQWGMMYVTIGSTNPHCGCCAACTNAPGCTCGCASCIYGGAIPGSRTYDEYSVLSYSIY